MEVIYHHNRAQISIEFLVILGVLILALTAMLFFSALVEKDTTNLSDNLEKTKECLSVSRRLTALYTNGDGGEFRFQTDNTLNFLNGTLTIDDVSCNYYARMKETEEISITGKVSVKNVMNFIVIRNY